jgi:hypothetical protein
MNCREKVHIASCTYIVMVGQKFAHILNTWTARALKWVVIDWRRIVILSYLLPLTFLTRIRNHYVDLKILSYLFCPPTLTIVLYFFIYLKKETSFFRIGDMISFVFYFWELGIIFLIDYIWWARKAWGTQTVVWIDHIISIKQFNY